MAFKGTPHKPCLYYKHDANELSTLILCQVDDFFIANIQESKCHKLRNQHLQHIGELIFTLTVCCIAVITRSQHLHQPVTIHYKAAKRAFAYILAAKLQ
eukprot:jgi/Psemu1/21972/gm1.21972_g